ncbi:MAG: ABC transporter ATP-binding protein [Planctomycetota bacterium]
MIEIRRLRKEYRRGAETLLACSVRELVVERGEQIALMGKSGCGKTTLLNTIAGIQRPSSGSVVVCGTDLATLGQGALDRFRARHIGIVFQTFNLLQPFTAYENVLLGATFSGRLDSEHRRRAHELLGHVGLGDRIHHRPRELSIGQQQRVALCRALIHEPELILADEPLGNQDRETGAKVLALLLEIASAEGRTVVMVTHDPESAKLMRRTIDLQSLREAA